MTRTAAWMGVVLGASALVHFGLDLAQGVGPVPLGGGAVSLLVLVGAVRTLGGHRVAQTVMCSAALPLLARFLVIYFRTYRAWPGLALIGLSMLTFGLGVLGYFLDRFGSPSGEPDHPL